MAAMAEIVVVGGTGTAGSARAGCDLDPDRRGGTVTDRERLAARS